MEEEGPRGRTLSAHSGREFERGDVHRARGVNEAQPGVEPDNDGREAGGEAGGWSGGHSNFANESGRRRKLADTPDTKTILVPGRGAQQVIKGSSAVEDERWIYITEVKANGSKVYLCLACKPIYQFTGSEARDETDITDTGGGVVGWCWGSWGSCFQQL